MTIPSMSELKAIVESASRGEKTTLQEDVDTNSEAFRRWFAASKIVDASGSPLRLYRGLYGPYAATADRMEPRDGYAAFFSTSPYVASSYASIHTEGPFSEGPDVSGAVFPVYIKTNKLREFPAKVDRYGQRLFDMFEFDRQAKRLAPGEALVVRDVYDVGPRATNKFPPTEKWGARSDIYAIGKGTSVKSALSNTGDFSDSPVMMEMQMSEKHKAHDDLVALADKATRMGVTLRLQQTSSRKVYLDFIERMPTAQKGVGADIMKMLCDLADHWRFVIYTYAWAADPKLIEYYSQFGFEEDPSGGDEAAMRRLPKRARKLTEGRDAPLYHGCTAATALRILDTGVIRASRVRWGDKVYKKAVSTSRDPRLRYASTSRRAGDVGRAQVQFVLDQAALAQKFRLEPYSWQGSVNQKIGTEKFHSPRYLERDESEEQVFGDIPVTPRYIQKIILEPGAGRGVRAREIVRLAGQLGIPVQRAPGLKENIENGRNLLPIPATPENITKAKAFLLRKWKERWRDRNPNGTIGHDDEPSDLSGSCKFSSMFAQKIFGGQIRGNYDHQFVVLRNGKVLDLNGDAADVKGIKTPYIHDRRFFGNRDHKESMRSCEPRVERWVSDFLRDL